VRAVVFLAVLLSSVVHAAPDEDRLGKQAGYPVCPPVLAPLEERCLVGTLSHYDEVIPAHTVKAGAPRALKRVEKAPKLAYTFRERPGTVDSFLAANRNTGLLILKGDTILVERYQYERKPTDRFQSYSMAKTVVAILIGIALEEKLIHSIDDQVNQYVPRLRFQAYGDTSLRHLLTMSSGVKFSEQYDGSDDIAKLAHATLFQQGPGGVDAVLPFNFREARAGTRFSYASAETEVLSLVLAAETGKKLADYLSEKLWRPMGAEADATWLVDGGGNELGYMGLNVTLRDWGRLGMLLANDGALDGKQIIPQAWVHAMTRAESPHLAVGTATKNNGYGYQTWIIDREGRFALLGVRGQGIFIDPQTKLVMVHTAVHASSRDPARAEQFALFYGVLNSLKDQKDL